VRVRKRTESIASLEIGRGGKRKGAEFANGGSYLLRKKVDTCGGGKNNRPQILYWFYAQKKKEKAGGNVVGSQIKVGRKKKKGVGKLFWIKERGKSNCSAEKKSGEGTEGEKNMEPSGKEAEKTLQSDISWQREKPWGGGKGIACAFVIGKEKKREEKWGERTSRLKSGKNSSIW